METFRSLRLRESKDSIINKMPNLTDEQKAEAKAFFNKYPAFEKEVDWNLWKRLTWADLEKVIKKDRTYTSKSQSKKAIRKGLDGFVEGRDYDVIWEGNYKGSPVTIYQPYTWEASRMIASANVPPLGVTGQWCTAYQKEDGYWRNHTFEGDDSIFLYIQGDSIPTKKVALEINDHLDTNCDDIDFEFCTNSGVSVNVWDVEDQHYVNNSRLTEEELDFIKTFVYDERFIKTALVNEVKIVNSNYVVDEKTGLIAYIRDLKLNDNDLDEEGRLVLKRKFDILKGDLTVEAKNLKSFENFPKKVTGALAIYRSEYLTSLEGMPQEVDKLLLSSLPNLTSLKGMPNTLKGRLFLEMLTKLKSFEGACASCDRIEIGFLESITSLVGIPKANDYDIAGTHIVDLVGLPTDRVRNLTLETCRTVQSIKGCPQVIEENLKIIDCRSFEFLTASPKEIRGSLTLRDLDALRSLAGISSNIKNLYIGDCPNLRSAKGITGDIKFISTYHMSDAFNDSLRANPGNVNAIIAIDGQESVIGPDYNKAVEKFGEDVVAEFHWYLPDTPVTVEEVEKAYIGKFDSDYQCLLYLLQKSDTSIPLERITANWSSILINRYIREIQELGEEKVKEIWSDMRGIDPADESRILGIVKNHLGNTFNAEFLQKLNPQDRYISYGFLLSRYFKVYKTHKPFYFRGD